MNDLQYSQVAGLQKTTADLETNKNEFSNKISACTPIRDQQARSVGALCTDFHLDIVTETRSSIARTLGVAFLAIYPAMILLVLYTTRSLSKFSIPRKKLSSEQ